MRSIYPLLLLLIMQQAISQPKQVKASFATINQVGVAMGNTTNAAVLQSINGIRKGSWFAGVGVGIDHYIERSVPVFVALHKNLSSIESHSFLYVNGGIHYSWLNFVQRENLGFPSYKGPGLYYDAGMGYAFKLKPNNFINVSAGYALKQLSGSRIVYNGPPISGGLQESTEDFKHTYRRLVLKVGLQL